jgi:release factor glutamine methyltransferase
VTVLEVIQRSADFLEKKGVESPRLQVELLLAHLLQMPRMKLYLNFERVLTETELEKLREFVKRRGNREPLQHVIGSTNFCGLEFIVNRNVLIPRSETEILAERAWNFLSTFNFERATALDFGTGSGCLAVMLAKKCPLAEIHALDVSVEAIEVARENAKRHEVEERIQFHLGNGFAALPNEKQFELIVSNPPYIPSEEIATLEPEVRDHDPKSALDGGVDGLDFYRALAKEAKEHLAAHGCLMLEFGEGQADSIKKIFEEQKWIVEAIERDYNQRERILVARFPK